MNGIRKHRSRNGFVLLEVMVSIMILGIALGASIRAFTSAMINLRKIEATTTGIFLADQFLSEIELIPAGEGEYQGGFDPDLFPNYFWELDVERAEVEYDSLEFDGDLDEFEPLFYYQLRIYYDDGKQKSFKALDADSFMMGTELFSTQSKQEMQIF